MNATVRSLAFAGALVAALSAPPSEAATPASLAFTVLRNGEPIGSHTYTFEKDHGALKVTVDTSVAVKVVMIPVYRFEHHDEEVWRDDRLTELASKTNDDGTRHHLNVAADASGLEVDGDEKPSRLPAAMLPASLWNPDTVRQGALMNTLDGHPMTIHVADAGEETVDVHGHPTPAHHYVLTGDLARELWYDAAGTLVQVRFKAKDDSDLRYVLK